MIITYLGHEAFKVQFGNLVVAFNPPSKNSQFKVNKFGADVVLQTTLHDDMSGGKDFSYGEKEPFVISGPGEYETAGIFVHGIQGESNYDGDKRTNTIYSLTIDGINTLFLGAQSGPLPDISEIIDTVDLLFIPIGGDGVYDAKEAYKMANNLEPKMIIPMHFKNEKDEALKAFLKEAGVSSPEVVDKLTIKRKDIENKESEIVVLSPQS